MKAKVCALWALVIFITGFWLRIQYVEAFTPITAQEAYNMVISGEATLIDVRTLEEYTFVGSPSLEDDSEPIAYLLPWKLFDGIDENGKVIYRDNPDFDALVMQTFGDSSDRALIVMCAIGVRSTYAAKRMEELGFINVYEIDNKLKELTSSPGGCGGFQGSNYQGGPNGYKGYNGYRGYPGRLSNGPDSSPINVATVTDDIENQDDSVAWMDTGLPITQKIDPIKIPKLNKVAPQNTTTQNSSGSWDTIPSMGYQGTGYQAVPSFLQPTYSFPGYPFSTIGTTFQGGNYFPDIQFPTWDYLNQPYFQNSYSTNPLQLQYSPFQSSTNSYTNSYLINSMLLPFPQQVTT